MLSHARLFLAVLTLFTFCLCFANFAGGRAEQPIDVRNISLVGTLKLQPLNEKAHADVAGYKNLAFIGKWGGACTGMGVDSRNAG
jgi:hypothetical protein